MIMEFRQEVKEHLESKNIFVEDKYDEFIYVGMILSELFNNEKSEKSIRVGYLEGDLEQYKDDFNLLFSLKNSSENYYTEKYSNLEEDQVLKKWFNDNLRLNSSFYYGELNGKVHCIVFIDYINLRNLTTISSLIPKITRSLFSKEQRAAKVDFLRSLIQHKGARDTEKLLEEKSDIDWQKIKEEKKRKDLIKCMQHANKARRQRASRDIEDKKRRARELLDNYSRLMESISDLQYTLFAQNDEEISESLQLLMDFLCTNPSIEIRNTCNNRIVYNVFTTISNYDIDMFKVHYDKTDKNIYREIPKDDRSDMQELLKLIFLDRKYTIPCSAEFELTIDNCSSLDVPYDITSRMENDYPDYIPQPHAVRYNCYGQFPKLWNEALDNGDYLGAIMISMSLAQNINWTDGAVSSWLVTEIYKKKYIKDAEGNLYSGKQLIKKKREDGGWSV